MTAKACTIAYYAHWAGVKVASYETHHEEEVRAMQAACEAAGLVMRRGNPNGPTNDVRVWVRRNA